MSEIDALKTLISTAFDTKNLKVQIRYWEWISSGIEVNARFLCLKINTYNGY